MREYNSITMLPLELLELAMTGSNGLPSGISATWSGNVITITGTPTVTGTFNYSVPLTGGCGRECNRDYNGEYGITYGSAGSDQTVETT